MFFSPARSGCNLCYIVNELVGIIFAVLLIVTIVVAPWLSVETRPEFLRPDLRHRHRWDGPMKDQ
jgi:hypothetical protein